MRREAAEAGEMKIKSNQHAKFGKGLTLTEEVNLQLKCQVRSGFRNLCNSKVRCQLCAFYQT